MGRGPAGGFGAAARCGVRGSDGCSQCHRAETLTRHAPRKRGIQYTQVVFLCEGPVVTGSPAFAGGDDGVSLFDYCWLLFHPPPERAPAEGAGVALVDPPRIG